MNLLQRYQNNPDIRLTYSRSGNLVTAKYLHMGVDFTNEEIRQARGIVLDKEGNIVAHAYPKFFNYGQMVFDPAIKHLTEWHKGDFTVSEKMDGSLGVLYLYDGDMHLGSTGSPDMRIGGVLTEVDGKTYSSGGDQILFKFKESLTQQQKDFLKMNILPNHSVMLEYIGPDNKIVVDYPETKFVIHGLVHTATGKVVNDKGWRPFFEHFGFDLAPVYPLHSFEEIKEKIDSGMIGKEGFVVHFDDGFMLKFKTDEYVSMHRANELFSFTSWSNVYAWIYLYDLGLLDDILVEADKNPFSMRNIEECIADMHKALCEFDDLYKDVIAYAHSGLPRRELFAKGNLTNSFANASVASSILNTLLSDDPNDDMRINAIRYPYVLNALTGRFRGFYDQNTFDGINDKVAPFTDKKLMVEP